MKKPNSISSRVFIALTFAINLICSSVVGSLYSYHNEFGNAYMKRQVTHETGQFLSQLNNLAGKPGEGYYVQVEIGTPKQTLNVLIDTGSSNFAIACEPSVELSTYFLRNQSSTYKESSKAVNVPYTQGSWNGILGQDYVTISSFPNSTVFATIACINEAHEFYINNSQWQGIMGLAYAGIARPDSSVEPIYDTMTREGKVKNIFSVALCGYGTGVNNATAPMSGSLILDGIQESLHTGSLFPTPIEKEWYYDVIIVDIQVNGQSLGMDCKEYNFGKTIVDTGTTNIRLPNRVFDNLVQLIKQNLMVARGIEMPREGFWTGKEVLCWDVGNIPYEKFPTVSLSLPTNSTSAFRLDISSLQYLRTIGDENDAPGKDCYKFGISSIDSGTVIGAVGMEGFYVVFDRENKVIKFGNSTCSHTVKSAPRSVVIGNLSYQGNYNDCVYRKPKAVNKTLPTVIVPIAIFTICALPLITLIVYYIKLGRCRCQPRNRSDVEYSYYKDCAYLKPEVANTALTIVGYVLAGVCGICVLPLITLMVYMKLRRCAGCQHRNSSDFEYSDLAETR